VAILAVAMAVGATGCADQATRAGAGGKFALRVSAGAEKDYVDQAGVKWLADQPYTAAAKFGALGGDTVRRDLKTIPGTKAPDVYLTERWGMTGYRFDVPNGAYTVRLHFAETWNDILSSTPRVFSVKINGRDALKDFDVMKSAGGFAKPIVKEFKGVEVTDGKVMVEFVTASEAPEINGIEILGE
jgi:hypothetical protein